MFFRVFVFCISNEDDLDQYELDIGFNFLEQLKKSSMVNRKEDLEKQKQLFGLAISLSAGLEISTTADFDPKNFQSTEALRNVLEKSILTTDSTAITDGKFVLGIIPHEYDKEIQYFSMNLRLTTIIVLSNSPRTKMPERR